MKTTYKDFQKKYFNRVCKLRLKQCLNPNDDWIDEEDVFIGRFRLFKPIFKKKNYLTFVTKETTKISDMYFTISQIKSVEVIE